LRWRRELPGLQRIRSRNGGRHPTGPSASPPPHDDPKGPHRRGLGLAAIAVPTPWPGATRRRRPGWPSFRGGAEVVGEHDAVEAELPAQQGGEHDAGEDGRRGRVNGREVALDAMTNGSVGPSGSSPNAATCGSSRVVCVSTTSGSASGVLGDPAQARKVLEGRGDAPLCAPVEHHGGGGRWGRASPPVSARVGVREGVWHGERRQHR
jgi:hypothetical protein